MMNLKPLGDRVIVKQDEAEETTAGGLILAHDAKEKPQTGVVLKVGEGKLDKDGNLVPVPVKEGDRVLYGKYGGTEVKVNGEENNLLELIAADPAFGLSLEDLKKTMEPSRYVGRAPEQVDAFLGQVVKPILEKYSDILGEKAEINV